MMMIIIENAFFFCSAQVTLKGVPPNFDRWHIVNFFGRAGMLNRYPQNNLPMVYIWKSNGVPNGNVTLTYESAAVAQNAVTMFNNQVVYGHHVTAYLSYYEIPNPVLPPVRNQGEYIQCWKQSLYSDRVISQEQNFGFPNGSQTFSQIPRMIS